MNQAVHHVLQESSIADATYKVVLRGTHPNVPPAEAKAKLATLFKASPEQVEKLLQTAGYVVKKGIPIDTVSKYKNAIETAGGVCDVIPEEPPMMSLDVDLPGPALSRDGGMGGERLALPVSATTAPNVGSPPTSLPEKWTKIFALIDKAGGPKMPKIRELPFGERRRIVFNVWAFLLGPIYYPVKGMWKKGIVLFTLSVAAVILVDLLLEAFGIFNSKLSSFIAPAVFGTRANIDYYKKMVLGENGWW